MMVVVPTRRRRDVRILLVYPLLQRDVRLEHARLVDQALSLECPQLVAAVIAWRKVIVDVLQLMRTDHCAFMYGIAREIRFSDDVDSHRPVEVDVDVLAAQLFSGRIERLRVPFDLGPAISILRIENDAAFAPLDRPEQRVDALVLERAKIADERFLAEAREIVPGRVDR